MARSFTEEERARIREKLMAVCISSWAELGYKKTSVDALCEQVGISKGAFYLFYGSKEELFSIVLHKILRQVYEGARALLKASDRESVIAALKYYYREYDRYQFMQDSNCADYLQLMAKLSGEQRANIEDMNARCYRLFLECAPLKVNEEMAASVIYSLIMGVKNKEVLPEDHYKVYDFMVETMVDALYEWRGES